VQKVYFSHDRSRRFGEAGESPGQSRYAAAGLG